MIIVTGEARFAAGGIDRLRGLLESTVAAIGIKACRAECLRALMGD